MFSRIIFWSRWLQLPLYLGLIVVLLLYVLEFGRGLYHFVLEMPNLQANQMMLEALDLVDVVMIANLLIMVIIGGYENFVSHLNIHNHPDKPEWLDELNAGTMKVKLALALISISSIQLLRTFINPNALADFSVMWQILIHLTLLVSALAIAFANRLIIAK